MKHEEYDHELLYSFRICSTQTTIRDTNMLKYFPSHFKRVLVTKYFFKYYENFHLYAN